MSESILNNLADKSLTLAQKELIQLLKTGGNEQIEFKISFDREAIETLSAFANTRGGSVLKGVDDSGVVKGLELGKETLQNWNNQIKQSCAPSILPESNIVTHKGRQIVVLSIPEYPVKSISCKGKYFKRVNNSNHRMTITEISDLHLKTSPLFEELQEGFRVTVTKTTRKTTQQTTRKTTIREQVLELLRTNSNMTRSDIALQLFKSENTIKEHLAKLKAEGRLKRTGSDRSGYWVVVCYGK